ncbi:LGFP repeat-containing protein [Amnibacterium sp.]|uniref:LGFP repeat-containing protein n=1 Tax=Amnibacterium sp. TaxID=1872496 RepID=UPI003F7C5535
MSSRERMPRFRRFAAIAAGVALVAAGVGLTAVTGQSARASVLDGFDPANIIDDSVMFNGTTMSASDIQSFLNAKQPTCSSGATCLKSVKVNMPAMTANPMCKALPAKSNATAAQVIAAVGAACNVNPEVILVMLQKEQTLVTGRMPGYGETVSLIYRKATGLGCPDTAACDPSKYGLFNQLYGVAYWLVRYTSPPGTTGPGWTNFNWFPVGKPNGVLYNPNATCGAQTITIKNKATASLYYYTPYQPNAAALAAGWGLGNGCSSYGNRNFYLYFTTWFGSTHLLVTGAIKTFWDAHQSAFGNPVANAVSVSANGGGTYQQFQKATIYTSGAGSYGISGAVQAKYTAMGGPGGKLGWPRTAQMNRKAGTVQGFQNGSVYVSAAGTAAILAPVYATFARNGYENGSLGWPTNDAGPTTANGGGTAQAFQHGNVYVSGSGAFVLTGAVLTKYNATGGPAGELGWPRTGQLNRKAGTVQGFQKGSLYVSSAGTAVVLAPVYAQFARNGYENGALGWPVADPVVSTAKGGATWQQFQRGRVVVAGTTNTTVTGDVLAIWLRRGADANILGWPAGDPRLVLGHGSTGTVQPFQQGVVVIHQKSYTVSGIAGAHYVAHGGPAGALGWPVGVASSTSANGGGWYQRFAGGTIYWTAKTGAQSLGGSALTLYDQRGGVNGTLAWLVSVQHDSHGIGGTVSTFQSGKIYVSRAGSAAVRGDILAKYEAMGGTGSWLGWPTDNCHSVHGAQVQTFQHGTISWTASGGAKASRS